MAVQSNRDRRYINRAEVAPRIRAGADAQQRPMVPLPWIHDRAPRLQAAGQERRRREPIWALSE